MACFDVEFYSGATFGASFQTVSLFDAVFHDEPTFSATFSASKTFTATFLAPRPFTAVFNQVVRTMSDAYDGPYEVTPSPETQVLRTAGKGMGENVIINPIPNNYGLITWNGSTITVS